MRLDNVKLTNLLLSALFVAVSMANGSAVNAATSTRTDDRIPDLIRQAGTSSDYPDADVVVVFDRTEVEVEDSGLSHVSTHVITKILTDDGARDQAFKRFDYDPASQLIEIRAVRIHRTDGTVQNIDLNELVDVTAPAHAIYWGARMLSLNLPRLEIGDAVEIQTYKKGFVIAYLGDDEESRYIPPMRGHYYDVVQFQASMPMKEKTYTLRLPRDKPIQYSVYNGSVKSSLMYDDHFSTYTFWQDDCEAWTREWRSSGTSDYVPKVVMATVQDWGEKSRWFFVVNDDQFDCTPEIQAKVEEITKGLKSDDAKVSAINHWVANEIRYCGLNMGEGEGYTLHPGEMIFKERSGVCKDIAGMTITMLRCAGYEVYPAMTMAGSRVERIPADQFNHCVAALRQPDGSFRMLDPTWIPLAMPDWSRAEGEQNYLVGTPGGEDLAATRTFSPEENKVALKIRGEIDKEGTLVGTIRMNGLGQGDTRLRRSIGTTAKQRIIPRFTNWLAALSPAAELVKYKVGDVFDFSDPMPIEVEFRVPGYATVGQKTVSFQPISAQLIMANYNGIFRFAGEDLSEERNTPALIWYAMAVHIDERIKLPKGFKPAVPPGDWQTGQDKDFASCQLNIEPQGRSINIAGTIRVDSRTISVENWPVFHKTVEKLKNFGTTKIIAKRKGA